MDYEIRAKQHDFVMRLMAALLRLFDGGNFMRSMYTTYRLPFMRKARICYPYTVTDVPEAILHHELVHVAQFKPWYGPWLIIGAQLFPLPIFFSGRWFVERYAYLGDIKAHGLTPARAAEILWKYYGWPWPRAWMQRWFEQRLG